MTNIRIKSVTINNGETLSYRKRDGGEEVLLLIHGNMTSSKHWDLLIEEIDPMYTIYAVDLRGFGLSTYHKPIRSIKDFSDDIFNFVERLKLNKFSIIGWSTGGAVGMQFTIDYPEKVNKLILLASASTRGYPFYEMGIGHFRRLKTKDEIKRSKTKTIPVVNAYKKRDKVFLKKLWNTLIYTQNEPDQNRYDEYLEDMLTQRNLVDVYHALNIFNISNKHNGLSAGTGEARKITCPTLVLWGEKDLVISEKMTREIMTDLGGHAQVSYLKDCGHSPLIDDLDQLTKEILTFLKRK